MPLPFCVSCLPVKKEMLTEGQPDAGLATRVVMHSTEPLRNIGHVVFTDNFYTSPQLAASLMEHGLHLVGSLKINRHGIPQALKDVQNLDKHAEHGTMR